MAFQKGQSGNPNGRPKGSRNKLAHAFWNDFGDIWRRKGIEALEKVADEDPSTFVRVAASLMPKEAEITLRKIAASQIGDDELANIALGSSEGAAEEAGDPPITH